MTGKPQDGGKRPWWSVLGPGLITGAADDDPSGIGTYSQVGAQFGFALCWTLLLAYPLMYATQAICARLGRATGHGLAGVLRRHSPGWLLYVLVLLFVVANTINLGADLAAMGESVSTLVGGPRLVYVALFAVACAALQLTVGYDRYAAILKWLSLSLLAYVGTVLVEHVPWGEVLYRTIVPTLQPSAEFITSLVAVIGTTISPYLFFWQSSEEAEDERDTPGDEPLRRAPEQVPRQLHRIRLDTAIGMAVSNLVSLFIIITTAATLHPHGVTTIQSAAQAAQALRPVAGKLAETIFAAGVIGTGLLAVPVLSGSVAYAVAAAWRKPVGFGRRLAEAKLFYATLVAVIALGAALDVAPISPMRALFWSAFINGVIAVPIVAAMMVLVARSDIMGEARVSGWLRLGGWVTTVAMAAAVVAQVVASVV